MKRITMQVDDLAQETEQLFDTLLADYINSHCLSSMPKPVRVLTAELWKRSILAGAQQRALVDFLMAPVELPQAPVEPQEDTPEALGEPETPLGDATVIMPPVWTNAPPLVVPVVTLAPEPEPEPLEEPIAETERNCEARIELPTEPELEPEPVEIPTETPPTAGETGSGDWLEQMVAKAAETAYALRKANDAEFISGAKGFEWLVVEVMKAHDLSERAARSACSRAIRRFDRDEETRESVQMLRFVPTPKKVVEKVENGTQEAKPSLSTPPGDDINRAGWSPLHHAIEVVITQEGGIKAERAWEVARQFGFSQDVMRATVAEVEQALGTLFQRTLAFRESSSARLAERHQAKRVNKNGIPILH